MQALTLEQKVGQLFFIGISGPEIDETTSELLQRISPGGICLFARNIKSAEQTRELLDGIRASLPVEPFLSIDQEGGRVDRLRRIITPMPAASTLRSAVDVREFARTNAETLRLLGFNMNFAPVVDVIDAARESTTNGLYSRAFGNSADDVVQLADAFLNELQTCGITGCLKHFPGLGASTMDSHDELPTVSVSDNELFSIDLAPYRETIAAGSVKMVMVAHAAYPSLRLQETDQSGRLLPSSLSFNIVTKLLREELGFDGVAITDDLEMGAIVKNYGMGEACRMAINAGSDMLAICANADAVREGYDAVLNSVASSELEVSRIDASLARISRLKAELVSPMPFNAERLLQQSERIKQLNARLN